MNLNVAFRHICLVQSYYSKQRAISITKPRDFSISKMFTERAKQNNSMATTSPWNESRLCDYGIYNDCVTILNNE